MGFRLSQQGFLRRNLGLADGLSALCAHTFVLHERPPEIVHSRSCLISTGMTIHLSKSNVNWTRNPQFQYKCERLDTVGQKERMLYSTLRRTTAGPIFRNISTSSKSMAQLTLYTAKACPFAHRVS